MGLIDAMKSAVDGFHIGREYVKQCVENEDVPHGGMTYGDLEGICDHAGITMSDATVHGVVAGANVQCMKEKISLWLDK